MRSLNDCDLLDTAMAGIIDGLIFLCAWVCKTTCNPYNACITK